MLMPRKKKFVESGSDLADAVEGAKVLGHGLKEGAKLTASGWGAIYKAVKGKSQDEKKTDQLRAEVAKLEAEQLKQNELKALEEKKKILEEQLKKSKEEKQEKEENEGEWAFA